MPKRTDIKKILIIGAGPIVIGQGCEFDYSGVQAVKALKEDGYQVVLVNSNPATIMTDPSLADSTYIEPIRWQNIKSIIEKEQPCALLPTMGGQTALNCALDLNRMGVLKDNNVELIGATVEAIDKAEDRSLFAEAMQRIGLEIARGSHAHNMAEARKIQKDIGFPAIIRPSFTLGGSGGGIAYNIDEFETICARGLALSPTSELLIEESIVGWKEYEMEVVRDLEDNVIIVCGIENFDAMGVHTGDSITVAPIQTLTDKEYQQMRNASVAVLREIGVETGGANVQFAVCPKTGRMIVVEMNPRVSRSSALASKATGFPIAKVAAKLAVGYTLSELRNEITQGAIPASFEPSIDYVVTKIPRFNFEKFPTADARLTTQMKSVGEVMAIGQTFAESVQKALAGLEVGLSGFDEYYHNADSVSASLRTPNTNRILAIADAYRFGFSLEKIQSLTGIDSWFLEQIRLIVEAEKELRPGTKLSADDFWRLKQLGFTDARLAKLLGLDEITIRNQRLSTGVKAVFKRIDSCAAEFPTSTAYLYSTYSQYDEARATDKTKVLVLGSGPNRIGQGIEFDYCCVHAAMATRELGFETLMFNCNPETVSTDFDTSDKLFFEPLTFEFVANVVDTEQPDGLILQFGGQTPLKLAKQLDAYGAKILGTPFSAIDRAEDRKSFSAMVEKLKLKQPRNATQFNQQDALKAANTIGYPVMVRPSYVLGGRAMQVVQQDSELVRALQEIPNIADGILIDEFLDNAKEIDVDAVSDGKNVLIAGIMEHVEQAGVHSGDSACALPPFSLSSEMIEQIEQAMTAMVVELGVVGLANAQFAIREEELYVIEVNPRASRTVPFVSKTVGIEIAKIAAKVMQGHSLASLGVSKLPELHFCTVKKPVFPFEKFPNVDPILGPEMRSTGEVMGIGSDFSEAFAKAHFASGDVFNDKGTAFLSVRDADKPELIPIARKLIKQGFSLVATEGTWRALRKEDIAATQISKVYEGQPNVVDLIINNTITFVINTTEGRQAIADSYMIRKTALNNKVSYVTTIAGARAIVDAIAYRSETSVRRLQDQHRELEGVTA